jgi:hypothetical protein
MRHPAAAAAKMTASHARQHREELGRRLDRDDDVFRVYASRDFQGRSSTLCSVDTFGADQQIAVERGPRPQTS